MDLKGIISISGMSGLYKILTTNKNGFIVESFTDKKRFAVSSAQRVSTLEDITIYTEDGDIPLKDVLKRLDEKTGKEVNPDPKANPEQMKKVMTAVLPEYDKERVYNSDIKKLFTWYNILKDSDFSFEDTPEAEVVAEEEDNKPKSRKKQKKSEEGEKKKPKTAKKEEKTAKQAKRKKEAAQVGKTKAKPKSQATSAKAVRKSSAKKGK